MDLDKRKLAEAEVDTLLEGLDEVAIVKESTMEEDEVTNLERIVEKSIGNKMLCPIKQATANHARECDRSKCAWYLDQENRCAMLSWKTP